MDDFFMTQSFIKKYIGYIGLGKMGFSMVEQLLEKEWRVAAYNRSPKPIKKAEQKGATPAYSIRELIEQLHPPRLVWIMVSHQAVGDALKELTPLLSPKDCVIDGGNSLYTESIKRAQSLKEKGIRFLDVGVSGGPYGARRGACCMVGGARAAFRCYEHLFRDISVKDGYGYMGASGSGHFVKMVHNGIEYGMMQAIGEGFAIMKESPFRINLKKVTSVYNHGSVIESRLIGWLASGYKKYGEDLRNISGKVSASGEGEWTVQAAKKFKISVPIIEGAFLFRIASQASPSYTGKVISALRNQFGGHNVAV